MMKKIGKVIMVLIIGRILYVQGYNKGIKRGKISGFLIGEKIGHIRELINQGYTYEDAKYIINNRNKDNKITEEELN